MAGVIAVIGGSGCYELPFLSDAETHRVETPFGDVFGLESGYLGAKKVLFLPRHGRSHRIPPHKINYRANIWALREQGADAIVSLNSVGGISDTCGPETLVVPDQIIDYTWGREHSFADLLDADINHIDFTHPFDGELRKAIFQALSGSGVDWVGTGTYGCMQGPRLESAAEVQKLKRDGCTLVGMTAMPEAALARELGLPYASICPVVNWAAGIGPGIISMHEMHSILVRLNGQLLQLLQALIPAL